MDRLQGARRLAALAEARWLLTGPAGGPGDPALLDLGAKSGADTPATLVCESFSTLLALMREGDYLAVMPQGFFDFYGPPMNLVRLPIRDPLPITPVYAMWRAEAPLEVMPSVARERKKCLEFYEANIGAISNAQGKPVPTPAIAGSAMISL